VIVLLAGRPKGVMPTPCRSTGSSHIVPDTTANKLGAARCAVSGEIVYGAPVGTTNALQATIDAAQMLADAWAANSDACLCRLDGTFAFALRADDTAVLGRDPSGLRDLYWCRRADGTLASDFDLTRLASLPGVPRRLARRSLHEYLRFGDIAAPNTWYENIQAVEPGVILHVGAEREDSRAWPDSANGRDAPADFASAVDTLDALLQQAVRRRLTQARRPAAFLSGGIDSSLLCALAGREHPDLCTITVGFDGPDDESPLAQRVATHLGLRHETLRFARKDLVKAFERLIATMDQPMADPATPATVLAFDHCRERHDVVLDGTGADEAVGAMPPRHVRVAVQYASLLPRGMRRALTTLLRALPPLAPYAPIVDFEHPADTMIRWHGFTRGETEALCGEPVSFEHTRFYRTFARFPRGAHFERYSALIDAMPCERLTQATRASPATVRYPFCDRDVDRYLRRLPRDFRQLPGEPKRILHALLARYVPRELWDAPKRGFNFPLHDFLAGDDFALVRQHLDKDRWRRSGVLSPEGVSTYGQRFIGGDRRLTFRVWLLVVLGAWLDKHSELG
jgi:asparagine synthase (glutamine-hydrolysing)